MYNIFPKEIWISIILELPCKYIHNFRNIFIECKDLYDTENLIYKRKIKGFPRATGYYKSHDISKYDGSFYSTRGKLISGKLHELISHNKFANKDSMDNMLDALLEVLYKDNIDLVCGDLIDLENITGALLFDGEIIINLSTGGNSTNCCNIIPSIMSPIKNNISIGYWEDSSLLNNNNFILDVKDMKEELITNISYNENEIIYTWFILNNITYILFRLNNNNFKDLLLLRDELCLHFKPTYGLFFKVKDEVIENVYQIKSEWFKFHK